MSRISGLWLWLRQVLRRATAEDRMAEEIRFHIEMETEKNVRQGLSAEEARRQAWIAFGDVEAYRDEMREGRRVPVLEDAWRDVRYAVRSLRRTPAFTVAAVFTLACGIGASTAVFSAVRAALLTPPPYRQPERLAIVWNRSTESVDGRLPVAGPDVALYRSEAKLFEDFAFLHDVGHATLTGVAGGAEHVIVARATTNFLSLLGVAPSLGRLFVADEGVLSPERFADDETPIPPGPIVISHGLWMRRFGGRPDVLGTTVHLEGQSSYIVGVLPPSFRLLLPAETGLPARVDVWVPLRVPLGHLARPDRMRDQDSDETGLVVARLRPDVSIAAARAEMDAIAAERRAPEPLRGWEDRRVAVVDLQGALTQESRPILLALLGSVGLLLLLACASVAGLLVARATGRGREMAVRRAVGATHSRLTRQLLTESAVLAFLGGLGGLLLAQWSTTALVRIWPSSVPLSGAPRLDVSVLGFAGGAMLLSVFLSGSLPALHLLNLPGASPLSNRSGASGGKVARRIRNILVILQMSFALALLAGSAHLIRSSFHLHAVRPGFATRDVLVFDLRIADPDRYRGPADRARFIADLETRLAALPRVKAVGVTGGLPLTGRRFTQPYGVAEESPDEWTSRRANFRVVTPGYFRALGTRVLGGRAFTPADDRQDRRVVIVSERLARRIAPDLDRALGQRIGVPLDGEPEWAEVVGVVEDVRFEDLRLPGLETIYVPYRHEASREVTVVLSTDGEPGALAGLSRRILQGMDPGLAPYNLRSMQEYVTASIAPIRFALAVLAGFAGLALLLAVVALYATLASVVAERTQEIGVRVALGARPREVKAMVLKWALLLVGAGVGVGLPAALVLGRMMDGFLFQARSTDPLTLSIVALVLGAAALLAAFLPARRAARVDPIVALQAGPGV